MATNAYEGGRRCNRWGDGLSLNEAISDVGKGNSQRSLRTKAVEHRRKEVTGNRELVRYTGNVVKSRSAKPVV